MSSLGREVDPGIATVRGLCRLGAAIDAIAAIGLALPARSRLRRLAFPAIPEEAEDYVAGARTAAPLMAGWALLLAWVADDPVSRRNPLLLTGVPVVAGLIAVEALDVRSGRAHRGPLVPTLLLQGGLPALFVGAYQRAGKAPATAD